MWMRIGMAALTVGVSLLAGLLTWGVSKFLFSFMIMLAVLEPTDAMHVRITWHLGLPCGCMVAVLVYTIMMIYLMEDDDEGKA